MGPLARSGDFWSGLALAGLGAYIVSEARAWSYMGEDGPGAGFFPLWYGGLMIVLSLLLVAGTVVKRASRPAGAPLNGAEVTRAMMCWAALVACIALMRLVGFPIAFALLTWFLVAVLARQPQRVALATAIGGAALFYGLFEVALEVPLPKGFLF